MNQRKLGILLSYSYIFINIFITFLYVPFLLSQLGKNEYGLYSLAYSVISYLSILDLGFGNSMIRYVSKYKSTNNKDMEKQTNGMFLVIYSIIGIIAFILGFVLIKNVDILFSNSLSSSEISKISLLLFILLINVSLSFPLSIFGSYIIASEKFVYQKIIMILKVIIVPIISIPFLMNGCDSITIVIIMSVVMILMNICYALFGIFSLKMKFSFKFKDSKLLKEILGYSAFVFISLIVDNIFNNTDQVILGATIGTSAVSIYALAMQVKSINEQISTSISSVFLPKIVAINETDTKNGIKKLNKLFLRVSKIQFILLLLVLSGIICFGKDFFMLWAGPEYIDAYYILILILIPSIIPLSQNICISILQAQNKHKFRSLVYLSIAIINIFISIPLAYKFSGIGTAVGTCISIIVGHIIIMNIYYYKKIKIDIPGYFKNILKITVPILAYLFIFLLFKRFVIIDTWIMFLVFVSLYSLIYFIIIYFMLTGDDKEEINGIIKDIFKKLSSILPRKKYILLESGPDFSDSTLSIYNKMLKEGLNKKYKLIWIVDVKNKQNLKIKNVKTVAYNSSRIFDRIELIYYRMFATMIIDSNKFVTKFNDRQIRIHLTHGMPLKKVTDYFNDCGELDYLISPSEFFDDILCEEFLVKKEQIKHLGMARNDELLEYDKNKYLIKKLGYENKKIIVWLPTYRRIKNKDFKYNIESNFKLGIPIFYTKKSLQELDEFLIKNNIVILLKLHPAQDISLISKVKTKNLKILENNYLIENNINLYELLSISDSLITDYSSVYFDYLILNKPIGLTIDDIDTYEKTVGFVRPFNEMFDGELIKNTKDFYDYLNLIIENNKLSMKYNKLKEKYHKYDDNNSTNRLYDLIIELLKK